MVLCLHCGYLFLVHFIRTNLFGKPELHPEASKQGHKQNIVIKAINSESLF